MANHQDITFTLTDLVDLALCSPEIGAVNFNILRVVLHELVAKLGGDDIHPHLDDLQAHQIQNFKSYIQGAGTASPMPGVLRYNPPGGGGFQYSGKTPRTGRQSTGDVGGEGVQDKTVSSLSVGVAPGGNIRSGPEGAKMVSNAPNNMGSKIPASARDKELEQKVARLERHLEALYALPTNQQILSGGDKDKPAGMSVNDMWQIIQLNNRVAACEAAIQKMASLIEDLAKALKSVKTRGAGGGGAGAGGPPSDEQQSQQGGESYEPFNAKCEEAKQAVDVLKAEMDTIKKQWRHEMDQLEKATGQSFTKLASEQPQGAGQKQPGQQQRQAPGQQGHGQQGHGQAPGQQGQGQGQQGQAPGQIGQGQAGQGQDGQGQTTGQQQGQGAEATSDQQGQPEPQFGPDGVPIPPLPPGQAPGAFQTQGGLVNQLVDMAMSKKLEHDHDPSLSSFLVYPDEKGKKDTGASMAASISSVPGGPDPKTQARVGAAEAAIRKMGNLIEDLAKELKSVKHDRRNSKNKENDSKIGAASAGGAIDPQVLAKMEPIKNKCEEAKKAVDILKSDLENIKKQWKDDVDKLQHGQQVMRQSIGHTSQLPHNPLPPRQQGIIQIPGQSLPHIPGQPQVPGQPQIQVPGHITLLGDHAQQPPLQGIQAVQNALGGPSADTSAANFRGPNSGKQAKIGAGKQDGDDILHQLKTPLPKAKTVNTFDHDKDRIKISPSEMALLKEEQAIIVLPKDFDELRQKVKAEGKVSDVFDELEVLEKVATLWEAVDVLKRNQESIAVRLIKMDAAMQKMPTEHMDMLQQIPISQLEVLASSDKFHANPRGKIGPGGTQAGHTLHTDLQNALIGKSMGGGLPAEDMQTIFTNLNSLLAETDDQRDRVEQLYDIVQHLESVVVTKPMLVDAMGDKADKGQMNTKVSYDEFGNSIDELTNKLQNLLIEVYQKNEGWKRVTDQLIDEMGDKLDKYEIGPLRAYFKSHLGDLESQVASLVKQFNEPDPAGTRKKILRDYNCISCDRHTNISGVTNAATLPCIGPILAGHTTASQRAYDLYNMRNAKKFGQAVCDLNAIERTIGTRQGRSPGPTQTQSLKDAEVSHLVNRYVGGSHTAVSNADRISTLIKRPSTASPAAAVAAAARKSTYSNVNNTNNVEPAEAEPAPRAISVVQPRPQTAAAAWGSMEMEMEE